MPSSRRRITIRHSAEQAGEQAAAARASASLPTIFLQVLLISLNTPGGAEGPAGREPPPIGEDREPSPRRPGAGKGADRDRAPGAGEREEAREVLAADPAPRKRRKKEGVEDQGRVAGVVSATPR